MSEVELVNDVELLLGGTLAPIENKRFVATNRWTDSKGNPVMWEIKALHEDKLKAIRLEAARQANATYAVRTKAFAGHMNEMASDIEEAVARTDQIHIFNTLLAVEATVFPDLKNAALQDKFGVHSEADLLKAILVGGEFTAYVERVNSLNGFGRDYAQAYEEAKKD